MRVYLEIQRRSGIDRRNVTSDGIADGACPGCGAVPFAIKCSTPRIESDTRSVANGRCADCNDPVGYVYVERSTIFGAEEDRAMLEMARCRVY